MKHLKQVYDGQKDEVSFFNTATKHAKGRVYWARAEENMKGIDIWIENEKGKHPVDVKGMKKIHRGGKKQDAFHWVELSKKGGQLGWAYQEHYIAFGMKDRWLVVAPEDLRFLILQDLKDDYVKGTPTPMKNVWRKYGRHMGEEITLVPSPQLEAIAMHVWPIEKGEKV